jgi:hypothetical protein
VVANTPLMTGDVAAKCGVCFCAGVLDMAHAGSPGQANAAPRPTKKR